MKQDLLRHVFQPANAKLWKTGGDADEISMDDPVVGAVDGAVSVHSAAVPTREYMEPGTGDPLAGTDTGGGGAHRLGGMGVAERSAAAAAARSEEHTSELQSQR